MKKSIMTIVMTGVIAFVTMSQVSIIPTYYNSIKMNQYPVRMIHSSSYKKNLCSRSRSLVIKSIRGHPRVDNVYRHERTCFSWIHIRLYWRAEKMSKLIVFIILWWMSYVLALNKSSGRFAIVLMMICAMSTAGIIYSFIMLF